MAVSPPHPTGPPPPNVDRATPGVPVATWIFFSISFLVVAARVYMRFCLKTASRGWDDVCMITALTLGFAWAVVTSYQVHIGYGRHALYLTLDEAKKLGALNIAATDINALVLFFVRTSICIFLLRMTQGSHKSRQWALSISAALALNTLVAIATVILYSILCVPLNALWDLSVQGDCSVLEHATVIIKVLGSINSVVDFLCVIIPIVIISNLQLQNRTQLGLILILLSCGIVTAACSIGRIVSLKDQVESDPTYDWVDQTYWQIAEQYGGIIFASLPAIRQLSSHWKQTHSLTPSKKRKPYALDLSNRSNNEGRKTPHRGPSRSPGLFPSAAKRDAEDYIELREDFAQQHADQERGEPASGGQTKALPPVPPARDHFVRGGRWA